MTIKSTAIMIMAALLAIPLALSLLLAVASSQSTPPQYQSVSGEFAQKWIKDFQEKNGKSPPQQEDSQRNDDGEENGTDLWNWGNAPRGSKIVDGNLVTDPYYLRPLLNLSSDWMGESYTDSTTGLPMETYSDPLTGKKIYVYLNPTNSKPIFTYSTYPDPKTGNLVYEYIDPMTGKEVYASSAPIDVINLLAGRIAAQSANSQNEPWTRL
ncbi:MAG: hypothetical protein PHQ34_09170 [Methanothrix sp.]|nr:hypothetical protein [Methanothrix sp.]